MAMEINAFHPAGNLYECPVSTEVALQQHRNYQKTLKELGINCIEVSHAIPEKFTMEQLRQHAFESLKYVMDDENNKDEKFASDEYKNKVLSVLSAKELFNIIMMRPTIHLAKQSYNTGIIAVSTQLNPIGNLVFTRDQQITTNNGIIITNFTANQRKAENKLMNDFWQAIGYKVQGQTQHVMEGGDFVILDDETQMLGCGLRTSYGSGLEIMKNKWVSSKYFCIVKDSMDQDQDRMHLDCVFSPIHNKLCVLDETVTQQGKQRFVDVYVLTSEGYKPQQLNVEFTEFLSQRGVQIIKLSHEMQLAYGCNSLNLGLINNKYQILCAYDKACEFISQNPIFINYCKQNNVEINMQYIPFRGITSMYGCLHCASQVVERDNSKVNKQQMVKDYQEQTIDGLIFIPHFTNKKLAEELIQLYYQLTQQGKKIAILSEHVDTKQKSLKSIKYQNYIQFTTEFYQLSQTSQQTLTKEDCIILFNQTSK